MENWDHMNLKHSIRPLQLHTVLEYLETLTEQAFIQTFACNPVLGENSPPDNSTVQISQDVVRKALIGGLDCPEDRTGFPEPYVPKMT